MSKHLKIIESEYLEEYSKKVNIDLFGVFNKLKKNPAYSKEDFDYYLASSSLFSSKIEGNTLDFNSYYRNKGKKSSPKKKEVQEVENLIDAYKYASENRLTQSNFLKSHGILSKALLPAIERGKLRKVQIGVMDSATGRPAYFAVEPQYVKQELTKLFRDVALLIERQLSTKETFYYASMIHLWLAIIHPFGDGNGRSARLLEKWFLAEKLGMGAWAINSEKYYWDNRPEYYKNIALGFNYYALHWERCIPFLLMLPKSMI